MTGVTGCRSFLRKAFLLLLSFSLSLSFLGPGEKAFQVSSVSNNLKKLSFKVIPLTAARLCCSHVGCDANNPITRNSPAAVAFIILLMVVKIRRDKKDVG